MNIGENERQSEARSCRIYGPVTQRKNTYFILNDIGISL